VTASVLPPALGPFCTGGSEASRLSRTERLCSPLNLFSVLFCVEEAQIDPCPICRLPMLLTLDARSQRCFYGGRGGGDGRNADRRLARRRVAWAAAPFVLRPEAATHTFPEAHLPTRFTANRLFEIPAVGLQLGFFQALTWLGNGNQMRRRPSGRAARVSFRISLDSRSSSTRRASTIAPTIADQAAIAARRFSSAVSPSASALR